MNMTIGDILKAQFGAGSTRPDHIGDHERRAKEAARETWTLFSDTHSGGGAKMAWNTILIQAPYDLAIALFRFHFDRDPSHVTCSCCGEDYSVREVDGAYVEDARELPGSDVLIIRRDPLF